MTIAEPKTKEDILDRLTRIDFDGDLRHLGQNVGVQRLKAHVLSLYFPNSGKTFLLTVHKPRPEPVKKPKAKKRRTAHKARNKHDGKTLHTVLA